jgi:hypothetical protein
MVSGNQWNPIGLRSFFVLEEGLSVLSCHHIIYGLCFAMIISSISEVLFEDFSLFLKADWRRTDAAGIETFRHTFESMGWMAARWYEVQMGVREFGDVYQ